MENILKQYSDIIKGVFSFFDGMILTEVTIQGLAIPKIHGTQNMPIVVLLKEKPVCRLF